MNLVEAYTNTVPVAFDRNSMQRKKLKEEYKDPLNKWPIRGCAYSNEVGAAISSLAPKLGAALWVPALMYFGADIYDKYKNDATDYNPSGKRGLKQAIFQALASVILPTAAVHAGQKTISHLDKRTKQGLSTQAKENATEFCREFMSHNSLHKHQNDIPTYKNSLKTSLDTYLADTLGEYKSKSIFKKVYEWCFSSKHPEAMALADQDKLMKFVEDRIDNMFEMRSDLMQQKKPKDFTEKLYKKFLRIQPGYLTEYGEEKHLGKAAKAVLKDFDKSQIFQHKMFKTIGGFVALGLMIKPIDFFVEHIIIKKAVEPHLDKLSLS